MIVRIWRKKFNNDRGVSDQEDNWKESHCNSNPSKSGNNYGYWALFSSDSYD